jgi:hypothetical protein
MKPKVSIKVDIVMGESAVKLKVAKRKRGGKEGGG